VATDVAKRPIAFIFDSTSAMKNGLVPLKVKVARFFDTRTQRATQMHSRKPESYMQKVGTCAFSYPQFES
jgi:hypothetical protein